LFLLPNDCLKTLQEIRVVHCFHGTTADASVD